MMYVDIYLLASFGVIAIVHVTKGKAMPNFCCESKVIRRRIFVVEIWYSTRMPQESIDWDHALSKAKPQSPHVCKAPKANAKIMFLLPISKN